MADDPLVYLLLFLRDALERLLRCVYCSTASMNTCYCTGKKEQSMKRLTTLLLTGFCIASAGAMTAAAPKLASANGQGSLSSPEGKRQFSFSARQLNAVTGAAQGNAVLH